MTEQEMNSTPASGSQAPSPKEVERIAALIEELAGLDDVALKQRVGKEPKTFGVEFFQVLLGFILSTRMKGAEETSEQLHEFLEDLAEVAPGGEEILSTLEDELRKQVRESEDYDEEDEDLEGLDLLDRIIWMEKSPVLYELLSIEDKQALNRRLVELEDELDHAFFQLAAHRLCVARVEQELWVVLELEGFLDHVVRTLPNGEEIQEILNREEAETREEMAADLLDMLLDSENEEEFLGTAVEGHSLFPELYKNLEEELEEARGEGGSEENVKDIEELLQVLRQVEKKIDASVHEHKETSAKLLADLKESENPVALLEERVDDLHDSFFFLLRAEIQEANRRGQAKSVQMLGLIGNHAASLLREAHDHDHDHDHEHDHDHCQDHGHDH